MAGAVVNYPLVAGLIAFAIAQSTKFFTTWKELPTELFDNAEDVDFFEADACPVDMLILDL